MAHHSHHKVQSSALQKVLKENKSRSIDSDFQRGKLREGDSIEIGKWYRRSSYVVDNGLIVIQERSSLRKDPEDVQVFMHAGVEGGIPTANIGVETSLPRKGYNRIVGPAAISKVLHKIHSHSRLRDWFLSSLIQGTIHISAASTADGFIPAHVLRVRSDFGQQNTENKGFDNCANYNTGGVVLKDYIPLEDFYTLGGALAIADDNVLFKSCREGEVRVVRKIDKNNILVIGRKYIPPEDIRTVILIHCDNFAVGKRLFRLHQD